MRVRAIGSIGDYFLLAILIGSIWVPRALALDQFVTPDEPKWLTRGANFYFAIGQRDFQEMYQSEHPGVTTMWAGTAAFLTRFPEYRGTGLGHVYVPKHLEKFLDKVGYKPLDLLATGRFYMVVGNTIALVLSYFFARRVLGSLVAFVALSLVAFDPFHVALTRLLHLDGLLSSLMFLSLLAFFSYLRTVRSFDLIFSGIVAGVSWLTKLPGLFLIPVIGLVALLERGGDLFDKNPTPLTSRLWSFSWPLILWGFTGVLTFVLLWPAMWVDPAGSLGNIFRHALDHAEMGHENPIFFNGEVLSGDRLKSSFFHFYPITFLWRGTPVVLLGLLVAIITLISRWGYFAQTKNRRTMVGLWLFVLIFTLLMNQGAKKFDRYLLPVFPPLAFVAGAGWASLIALLKRRVGVSGKAVWVEIGAVAIVIGVQMIGVIQTSPYYLSYYNPLMGGSRKAPEVMMIGWGEGLDQAGRYLSQKANPESLEVASSYSTGSLSYYIPGDSRHIPLDVELRREWLPELWAKDYAIIYVNQWQRGVPPEYLDFVAQNTLEHTIWINGLEYVRIYKLKD